MLRIDYLGLHVEIVGIESLDSLKCFHALKRLMLYKWFHILSIIITDLARHDFLNYTPYKIIYTIHAYKEDEKLSPHPSSHTLLYIYTSLVHFLGIEWS